MIKFAREGLDHFALLAVHSLGFFTSVAFCSDSCTPRFPLRAPSLGADAAYSIPLPDGRNVWIFGDTLYGDNRSVNGDDPRIVRNSIGISNCDGDQWNLK